LRHSRITKLLIDVGILRPIPPGRPELSLLALKLWVVGLEVTQETSDV
jgi:hypothetical protein